MNPETPILMITLQIPVLADTSADQILDVIGRQVSDAIAEIKRAQSEPDPESIEVEHDPFYDDVVKEQQESFSDDTRPDILASLGYTHA